MAIRIVWWRFRLLGKGCRIREFLKPWSSCMHRRRRSSALTHEFGCHSATGGRSIRFAVTPNPFDITRRWHIDPGSGLTRGRRRRKPEDGNHVVLTRKTGCRISLRIESVTKRWWGRSKMLLCVCGSCSLDYCSLVRQLSKSWTLKTRRNSFENEVGRNRFTCCCRAMPFCLRGVWY